MIPLHMVSRLPLLLAIALFATQSGCLQVCYLAQAIDGQDEIQYHAKPIREVLADPKTPGHLLRLLPLVARVKRFGERMGLAPTPNYESYAALDRPVATWVVVAAPPLRLQPKTWWFPVVGSVPYLGWFNRQAAEKHAAALQAEGFDVHVRGASAYSTLGWFSDPILSSMLHPNAALAAPGLVDVVIHESVHATHYVESQSFFNESLANFVAGRLTPKFLREALPAGEQMLRLWESRKSRSHEKRSRMKRVAKQLMAIYGLPISVAERLKKKEALLAKEKNDLGPLNNAVLAQLQTYGSGEAAFSALLHACKSDWRCFMQHIKSVRASSFSKPQQLEFDAVVFRLAKRALGT